MKIIRKIRTGLRLLALVDELRPLWARAMVELAGGAPDWQTRFPQLARCVQIIERARELARGL